MGRLLGSRRHYANIAVSFLVFIVLAGFSHQPIRHCRRGGDRFLMSSW